MRLGKRYQLRDLNRVWTDAKIAELDLRSRGTPDHPDRGRRTEGALDKKAAADANAGGALDAEEAEQFELLRAIRGAIARARGPIYLVDLHTTSAHGLPFILFGDTLRQRRFASAVPLPVVLGLEEHLEGVLSAYWST
jgi:succinylglutamate desuccinylase